MSSVLPPIPWSHSATDFGSVWVWDTPHFQVTVNGDNRSCYYSISDRSATPNGSLRPFADGQATTFEQAERLVRETIGKAYKPSLGYQHYAGPLATTFTLGTGAVMDLGAYIGEQVLVTVVAPDRTEQQYRGIARVEHYELVVDTGASTVRISPTYVLAISPVSRTASPVIPLRLDRTMPGSVVPGCTGTPGFIGGTVEHSGRSCPIHEEP